MNTSSLLAAAALAVAVVAALYRAWMCSIADPGVREDMARQKEAALQDVIRARLAREPDLIVYRQTPILAKVHGGMVWCGLPRGSSDLLFILSMKVTLADGTKTAIGRCGSLEVKRPGWIPDEKLIRNILDKAGLASAAWEALVLDRFMEHWSEEINSMRRDKVLREDQIHVLEQEGWAAQVRRHHGFACYVDSEEAAVAAIERVRRGESC